MRTYLYTIGINLENTILKEWKLRGFHFQSKLLSIQYFNLHAMSIDLSILDKLLCFEPATLSLSDYQHCFDFDALKSFRKHDLMNTAEL